MIRSIIWLNKPHLPPAVSMYNHSASFPSPPSPFPPTAFFMVPNNLLTPPLLLFPLLHGWVNFVTCKIYLLLKYVRNESYIYGHIWLYIGSQKEILYWENSCGFPAQANKFQTLFIGNTLYRNLISSFLFDPLTPVVHFFWKGCLYHINKKREIRSEFSEFWQISSNFV